MKTYKQIDFWGSVVLIIGFAIASLIRLDSTFIAGYFIVGAWQLISIVVHEKKHWFNSKWSDRRFYHKMILTILICVLISLAICAVTTFGYALLLIILFPLLIVSPVFAVYYTTICYHELFVAIPKRELAHLK